MKKSTTGRKKIISTAQACKEESKKKKKEIKKNNATFLSNELVLNESLKNYYKPIKKPISIRLDADVIEWVKSLCAQSGDKYQKKINEILRKEMENYFKLTKNKKS